MTRVPDEFLWGVAISSHQNEGGAPASDWTHAERAGRFPHVSGCGTDFRTHWREDFDRIKDELGANAIRLSIEWARVEPEPGKIDAEELRWLETLFEGARDRGLGVIATLHHFTSPQWLYRGGWPNGWENPTTAARFANYTRVIAKEFGEAITYWITFNEPSNLLLGGHFGGKIPPFKVGPLPLALATRTLVSAHARAYDTIHELLPDAMVSFSEFTGVLGLGTGLDYVPGRFLDLLHAREGGRFKHMDFVGLHYYGDIPPMELLAYPLPFHKFGVRPERFGKILRDAHARYGLPILIGENGIATKNHEPRPDGWDAARYVEAHVDEVTRAMADGVPVLGYCWWTLTDNFEWGSYDARFGLYRVDCQAGDYTRHATPAVAAYRKVIDAHR